MIRIFLQIIEIDEDEEEEDELDEDGLEEEEEGEIYFKSFNPLSTNHPKWSNTFKQFFGCCGRIV